VKRIVSDLTRVDFHSHTFYSLLRIPKLKGAHFFQDSALSPKLLVKIARKKVDAIALTDHDNSNGIKSFLHYASKYKDIVPIVGQEVTKFDHKQRAWAHILTYGARKVPWKIRFQPLPDFLDYLDDNNIVYVLAHPFDLSQSAPSGGYNKETYKINLSAMKRICMVEIVNGLQPKRHNYLAQIISRELGLPGIAGSDSHQPRMIGQCYTYVEGTTEDEILEYLRKIKKSPLNYRLKTKGTGGTYKTWEQWLRYLFVNLEFNVRYDIYRHLNPDSSHKKLDPVYDKLYYSTPMFTKILAQAALPYVYTGLRAGMKIFLPRMQKMADKKEVRILRSLIDHQAIDENRELAPIEIPYSYEDLCVL
jgi:predicted metal-dependent phosphoesterase TrpH